MISLREDICAKLPVRAVAEQVNDAIRKGHDVVLTAAPGAGKSTLVPLTLLQGGIPDGGRILMLEPRRLAARQIAERMAFLAGESVGRTIGYNIRFERKVSPSTRIEVITEGILTRRLLSDPTMEGISAVIFDEFHERSLESDLALSLLRDCCRTLRPDLRIIIMSATIDSGEICRSLNAVHIDSPGKIFPVTIEHAAKDTDAGDCAREVARAVSIACREREGDILAFLPGEAEIRRCEELLDGALGSGDFCFGTPGEGKSSFGKLGSENPDEGELGIGTPGEGASGNKIIVCPLYGKLSSAEQRNAIAPSRPGERKIVLATSIAETSITIEGVRIVIDSGLCRKMVFDARNGLSHLETVRVSMDMAAQRSGRAGRTAPGWCLRLWTLSTEKRLEPCRRPEILDADLCPCVLRVASWEGSGIWSLPWMTPPPKPGVSMARQTLLALGAIDENGRATAHGRKLSALPCHPRIAQMLVLAGGGAQKALAADIAAILEDSAVGTGRGYGNGAGNGSGNGASAGTIDIAAMVNSLRQRGASYGTAGRAAEQYRRMAGAVVSGGVDEVVAGAAAGAMAGVAARVGATAGAAAGAGAVAGADREYVDSEQCGALLAKAFPEKIAKTVDGRRGHYMSAGGEMFQTDDDINTSDWIVAANVSARDGREGKIFLAARLDSSDAALMTREVRNVGWNSREGKIVARLESRVGKLLLNSKEISDVSDGEIFQAICEAAQKDGLSMFNFDDNVHNLQRRIAMVSQWHPELELPSVDTDSVLAGIRQWGPGFLCGVRSGAGMKKIDMCTVIWNMLDYGQQEQVDRLAPSHIEVPSGSRIRVEYRQGAEHPVLRVRLQECFGMTDIPRVDGGRMRVLMELLSPGYKPVQLTSDLRSFWNGTYFEVRKELRLRYPKHYWPENPLEAQAVRGVRKRG